tara:strand:- start:1742 stop:2149 length:408 start_codon:yes stop_codon:yes gene_type:complete
MIRDDVPEDIIKTKIMPLIENGGTSWEVVGTSKKQAKKMLEVVEVVEEPTPAPEPEPEPEPEPVVEEVIEDEPTPAATDAEVDVDILLAAAGFDSKMTRAQMMAWCSDKGIGVNNRSTKASMTDAAREYITGASE